MDAIEQRMMQDDMEQNRQLEASQGLRSGLIRLAHQHPEFRKDLLPLLKEAGQEKTAGIPRWAEPLIVQEIQRALLDWSHFEGLFDDSGFDLKDFYNPTVRITGGTMAPDMIEVTADIILRLGTWTLEKAKDNGFKTFKGEGGTIKATGLVFNFEPESYPELFASDL
jgi:hypothetical protein